MRLLLGWVSSKISAFFSRYRTTIIITASILVVLMVVAFSLVASGVFVRDDPIEDPTVAPSEIAESADELRQQTLAEVRRVQSALARAQRLLNSYVDSDAAIQSSGFYVLDDVLYGSGALQGEFRFSLVGSELHVGYRRVQKDWLEHIVPLAALDFSLVYLDGLSVEKHAVLGALSGHLLVCSADVPSDHGMKRALFLFTSSNELAVTGTLRMEEACYDGVRVSIGEDGADQRPAEFFVPDDSRLAVQNTREGNLVEVPSPHRASVLRARDGQDVLLARAGEHGVLLYADYHLGER